MAAFGFALGGCKGTSSKVDSPVVGPPPPRVDLPQRSGGVQTADLGSATSGDGTVGSGRMSSGTADAETTGRSASGTQCVARVDGRPIFESEVLSRYSKYLKAAEKQAPPEQLAQFRRQLLMKDLPEHLEQAMLNQKVNEKFGAEAVAQVEEQLDGMFADRVIEMKQQTGSKTLAELEDKLAQEGLSLASQKRAFNNANKAAFYLQDTLQKVPEVRRRDIVDRYNRDLAEYTLPADVKWQQLSISYAGNGGRSGALKKLEQAVGELQRGESFDLVVGKYSDGAMKSRAGLWDYVTRGSLASRELEDHLFTLATGEISPPVKTDQAFIVARVADRRDERTIPLAEVQDQIRSAIEKERREVAGKQLLAQLWAEASLKTIFDGDPEWEQLVSDRMTAVAAEPSTTTRLQSPDARSRVDRPGRNGVSRGTP